MTDSSASISRTFPIAARVLRCKTSRAVGSSTSARSSAPPSRLARVYGEKNRNFVGQHFWARGYFVSTVGRDQEVIRDYIKKQEKRRTNAWSR